MNDSKSSTMVDIPYADDDEQRHVIVNGNSNYDDNDSLDRSPKPKQSISERKGANLKIFIDGDDSDNEFEKRDKAGPLISDICNQLEAPPAGGLRRNSFSMPALNDIDLDALRALHMNAMEENEDVDKSTEILNEITVLDDGASSMACSIAEPEDEKESSPKESSKDDSESDTEMPILSRSKFRTKRRASIAPLPAIRLNDKEIMANSEYDTQSVISGRSVTSVSSLASLLKEKVQSIPAMIRKRKKPKDYKIRIFTGILFLIIVFLVGYAYIMYNHKIMSKMYFEHLKFDSVKRLLHVSNEKGVEVLSGSLAISMSIPKAYACEHKENEECWEWSKTAKLHLSLDNKLKGNAGQEFQTARCYNFHWESLSENFHPTDCFKIGEDRGKWFGGGLLKNSSWQLEESKFNFTPFITGDIRYHQFGNAMRRYFINSLGVAIHVDDKTPLHIAINGSQADQFCIKAQYDNFAYVSRQTPLAELKYTICTASNIKVLHHNLTQKNLWDGLKQQDMNVIKTMFDEPVWEMSGNLSDVSISNFTDSIIALGYFRLGHVLISEEWQHHVGDFEMDEERFSQLEDIITVMHRRGFRISLTIQPFVSTESKTFAELVQRKLLVFERSTDRTIPALTKFKNSKSVGVLDPTNAETIPWLLKKLEKISKKYQIDSFYVETGTAMDMPKFYDCNEPILNPDRYKTILVESMAEVLSILGVSSAIEVPRPPAFLSLPQVPSNWDGLQTVFKSALQYGIAGYPFILPGPVGGDFIEGQEMTLSSENVPLPEKELYIRWLQLVSFLPVLRFKHLPSEYRDEKLTKMVMKLSDERQKQLKKVFENYFNDAMSEGLPLVRPLWMLDPSDAACLDVFDEFSIGEQIIVAPILKRNQTMREVYLPHGVWKDGIDGSLRKGSRWIHNYKVAEHEIAYFVRMPDNTRF